MCASQRTSGRCAWAKPDVLNVATAMRLTNAQAKSEQLVIRLTNFVFTVLVSFCLSFLVLAFFGFSLLSCHFWPFADVQNGNQREVTGKAGFAILQARKDVRSIKRKEV
jgi:hypothetical protein